MILLRRVALTGLLALLAASSPALARDVAFVEPGTGGGSATPDEAFKIEPKSEIDIGDSIINIVRRETLFFVNQTSAPIKIEKVALSSDSTVTPIIANDDCSKQTTIPPLSRCSIELSITPTGPGSWGIELLMTHNGPGRITRAKIDGKTGGTGDSDKKDRGLFLSNKDVKPIEFGDVMIGEGKVVRSALMVNDSASPITIYSVDVIEADKSLQKLDQGCTPDMDLKPGESCPVTLVWQPTAHGTISTDLIIRHSGQLGFAVIPVRGTAKDAGAGTDSVNGGKPRAENNISGGAPTPPTPSEVAKEAAQAALPMSASKLASASSSAATGSVHLIGTVGNRAVILKPDGSTAVVQVGDTLDLAAGKAKVTGIDARSATLTLGSKKIELVLEAVQELKDKAVAAKTAAAISGVNTNKDAGSSSGGGIR